MQLLLLPCNSACPHSCFQDQKYKAGAYLLDQSCLLRLNAKPQPPALPFAPFVEGGTGAAAASGPA